MLVAALLCLEREMSIDVDRCLETCMSGQLLTEAEIKVFLIDPTLLFCLQKNFFFFFFLFLFFVLVFVRFMFEFPLFFPSFAASTWRVLAAYLFERTALNFFFFFFFFLMRFVLGDHDKSQGTSCVRVECGSSQGSLHRCRRHSRVSFWEPEKKNWFFNFFV